MSDQERLDQLEAEGLKMHTPEFERQIAETMDGIFAQARRLNDEVHVRAERRERIATALAPGVLGVYERDGSMVKYHDWRHAVAYETVSIADELLDALDAAEARDREATK